MRSTIDTNFRVRRPLYFQSAPSAAAGLLLAAVLAGCATSSAARPPQTAAHISPKPVPAVLVAYGSAALNTVSVTLVQGRQLAAQLRQSATEDLATVCSDAGSAISGQYDAFRSVYLPSSASSVWRDASIGYRSVLSAVDECGMAADGNARNQAKVALRDLNYGLWYLDRVQHHLQSWSSAH